MLWTLFDYDDSELGTPALAAPGQVEVASALARCERLVSLEWALALPVYWRSNPWGTGVLSCREGWGMGEILNTETRESPCGSLMLDY